MIKKYAELENNKNEPISWGMIRYTNTTKNITATQWKKKI